MAFEIPATTVRVEASIALHVNGLSVDVEEWLGKEAVERVRSRQ